MKCEHAVKINTWYIARFFFPTLTKNPFFLSRDKMLLFRLKTNAVMVQFHLLWTQLEADVGPDQINPLEEGETKNRVNGSAGAKNRVEKRCSICIQEWKGTKNKEKKIISEVNRWISNSFPSSWIFPIFQ